jgi:hypothetical protein
MAKDERQQRIGAKRLRKKQKAEQYFVVSTISEFGCSPRCSLLYVVRLHKICSVGKWNNYWHGIRVEKIYSHARVRAGIKLRPTASPYSAPLTGEYYQNDVDGNRRNEFAEWLHSSIFSLNNPKRNQERRLSATFFVTLHRFYTNGGRAPDNFQWLGGRLIPHASLRI